MEGAEIANRQKMSPHTANRFEAVRSTPYIIRTAGRRASVVFKMLSNLSSDPSRPTAPVSTSTLYKREATEYDTDYVKK